MDGAKPRPDHLSIARAATVGLVAGIVASFVMDRFQAAVTALVPSGSDAEPATDKAADRLSKAVTGHELTAPDKPWGGQIVHYAFGAGLGTLYGIMAEHWRDVTLGHGTAFGVGVAALFDDTAVPALRLGDPPWRTAIGTHAYSLASHLVFGTILESARLHLRDALRPNERGPITPIH